MLEYRVSAAARDVSKIYETAPDSCWGYVVFVYCLITNNVIHVGVAFVVGIRWQAMGGSQANRGPGANTLKALDSRAKVVG